MTNNTDPVWALIGQWRDAAEFFRGDAGSDIRETLRACARELEAVLAQQPAAPSADPWQVQLADALDCFWNAACEGAGPDRSNVIGGMAEGFAAMAARLREHAAPQQPAGVDEAPTWSRQQPTVPGIYGIRGFNLCRPASEQFEAVVVVREYGGELVCNLHESTSEDDLESWAPICDLDPDFEWRVFVPGWQQQGGAE